MSLEQVQAQLNDAGFNLTGTLSPEAFDTLVPETWRSRDCASLLIVGNGGRALWSEFQRAPESLLREDPLDAYTARVLGEIARSVDPPAAVGLYWEQRRGDYLPMMKLAERAGLGSPSRLGILLHPDFGPWLAVRAVLYLPFAVASGNPLRFDPCSGCPAPCAADGDC